MLDVPVSFFYDDMPEEAASRSPRLMPQVRELPNDVPKDPTTRRETLELMRAYYRIPDPAVRKKVFDLAKALAESAGRQLETV